jgi:hypothetical protein
MSLTALGALLSRKFGSENLRVTLAQNDSGIADTPLDANAAKSTVHH